MKPHGLGLNPSTRRTRKREFLDGMKRVVPWAALVQAVESYHPKAETGRPPFSLLTMLPDETTILRFRRMPRASTT